MTHYPDLSAYSYLPEHFRPGTVNVGWLESDHGFERMPPEHDLPALLWTFCTVAIAETRGLHECSLCTPPRVIERSWGSQPLRLGSAEIRVVSREGEIYAAPNLIAHYVEAHDYKPPDAFVRALAEAPRPPSARYFDSLRTLGLSWRDTPRVE